MMSSIQQRFPNSRRDKLAYVIAIIMLLAVILGVLP
jgi:hypothetical protein